MLTLASCASINSQTTQFVGTPTYAAVDPASVQILHAVPARPHVRLGEVLVNASLSPAPTNAELEQKLRTEAAQLGADAVVVVYDHIAPSGAYLSGPRWDRTFVTISDRKLVGLAIKYS